MARMRDCRDKSLPSTSEDLVPRGAVARVVPKSCAGLLPRLRRPRTPPLRTPRCRRLRCLQKLRRPPTSPPSSTDAAAAVRGFVVPRLRPPWTPPRLRFVPPSYPWIAFIQSATCLRPLRRRCEYGLRDGRRFRRQFLRPSAASLLAPSPGSRLQVRLKIFQCPSC